MGIESRRSQRFTDFIPVTIYVRQQGSDNNLVGPFSGTIVDICSYGACLLMSTVTCKSFHIYHSTRKDESAFLRIKIESHPHLEGTSIDARPVWLNTFQREDFRERMIGIEFLGIEPQVQDINTLA